MEICQSGPNARNTLSLGTFSIRANLYLQQPICASHEHHRHFSNTASSWKYSKQNWIIEYYQGFIRIYYVDQYWLSAIFLTVGHSWFKIPFDNVALLTTSALCKSVPLRLNELQMKVGRVVRWLTRVGVPYMKPSTQVQAMSPVYHLRLICRTLSPVGWLWHASVILSRVALLGRVRWADGRILTMPYLPLIQTETRFCRAKPSHCGHVPLATGGALRSACVYPSIQLKSTNTVRSPKDWEVI